MYENDILQEEWEQPQINDAAVMVSLHYKCSLAAVQIIECPELTPDAIRVRVMLRGVRDAILMEIPDIYFGDTSGVHYLH